MKNISLGQNKEAIEKRIGEAYYQQTNINDITESIYIISNMIFRAYYKGDQLISYFLTLTNDIKIELPEQYCHLVNNKKLGNFTFYEVEGSPFCVESYVTNGVGHSFYAERYYFAAFGNYNYFYFFAVRLWYFQ